MKLVGDFHDLKSLSVIQLTRQSSKPYDALGMLTKMAEFGKRQLLYNLKQTS